MQRSKLLAVPLPYAQEFAARNRVFKAIARPTSKIEELLSMKPTLGSDRDGYEGITWAERARFGVLGAALDPADKSGRKNNYIDSIHRLALKGAFGNNHFN